MIGKHRTFNETVGTLTAYCNTSDTPPLTVQYIKKSEYLKLLRLLEAMHDFYGPQDSAWESARAMLGITTGAQDDPALSQLVEVSLYDVQPPRPWNVFRRTPIAIYNKTLKLRLFRLTSVFFTDEREVKLKT